jgi:hypothetical protein
MIGFIGTAITITIKYDSSQSMTNSDSLHFLQDHESLYFHCDWLDSDLRIGHFFSFRCLLSAGQFSTADHSTPREFSYNCRLLNWTSCITLFHPLSREYGFGKPLAGIELPLLFLAVGTCVTESFPSGDTIPVCYLLRERVLGEPLSSNELPLWLNYSGFQASCHNNKKM